MQFTKMQGAGNDFILVNGLKEIKENWGEFAKKVCDRHFGIGADGLMFCSSSKIADVKMNYYNSDGSRAEMCGNGIRCFSKFVFDNKIVKKKKFLVETDAGIKNIKLELDEMEKIKYIIVDMGKIDFRAELISNIIEDKFILNKEIEVVGKKVRISSVLMGVPHTVLFVDNFSNCDVNILGKEIEQLKIFKNKTNVNFIKKIDETTLEIKTWERGAGRTLACGTGCCASAGIARKLGIIKENKVLMKTEGGDVKIEIGEDYNIIMVGEAEQIYIGEI